MNQAPALQLALCFLDALRTDHGMRLGLEKLGPDVTDEDLVGLAHNSGFDISADQLRRAHALDWHMRQARFSAADPMPPKSLP